MTTLISEDIAREIVVRHRYCNNVHITAPIPLAELVAESLIFSPAAAYEILAMYDGDHDDLAHMRAVLMDAEATAEAMRYEDATGVPEDTSVPMLASWIARQTILLIARRGRTIASVRSQQT